MNMSFGVAAAPPAPSEIGGADPQTASSASGASSTPLPPVPAPFSLPSANFTFQAPPANLVPPSRTPAASSAVFPFASAPPRFVYANPPANVPPAAMPPSASPAPPFSMQPGFTFQGPSGNPVGAPGQPMLGMTGMQPGGVGQSSAVSIRPFPPTALQTTVSAPAQAGPPPAPLQVSGAPGPQAGSTPVAEAAPTQGTSTVAMSTGTGTSTEAVAAAPTGSFPVPGTQARPLVGQTPISTVPPPLGVVGARPGLVVPPSTAVPFAPPRPTFATNAVAPPAIVPPGVLGSAPAGMAPRFPSPPFAPMVRPAFPPRPGTPLVRPPGALIRPGALLPKFPMPDLSKAAGAYLLLEKPQTLVYVGKIASTVDDDFLRSILELCGPIKSWKRAQEPTTGTPKGFGFCEFELPDGVLRALRLLHGFSLEGQELLITVNHTTREYLERFVKKKKEKEVQAKLEASQAAEVEVEMAPGVEAPEPVKKPAVEVPKVDESTENQESDPKMFGIVNNEDKEKDDEAQKKLASLLEERAKSMPLPPPPPLPGVADAPCKSNSMSDTPAKSREGDSAADGGKSGGQEGNNEEETSKEKGSSELEKVDTGSSEQGRRFDHHRDRNRDRERERDRELDRGRDRVGRDRERERERERQEKEDREDEQSEREREKKRARRERDREMRNRQAERQFENREKDWERDEKEKERRRNVDREKEKEREKLRKRLIKEQEEGSDDDARKKVKRRGEYDEHKRRQREKEDDGYDRQKEEEEIIEAKQRKLKEEYEEQVKKRLAEIAEVEAAAKAAAKALNSTEGGSDEPEAGRPIADGEGTSHVQMADVGASNDVGSDGRAAAISMDVDEKRTSSPPLKKLGFGLIGSGKRAVVPSLFHQEDEEEAPKERGIRELVPIEYSVEEMQAVSSLKMNALVGNAAPNLAAAAEFAKSLGHISLKEELEIEHDKGRRQSEKSKSKDRERASREEMDRSRDRDKDKHRQVDGSREKDHTGAKFDTKQLIDTIPKTKDELFAYKIDWKIYDQHDLHERMKPWIQKKILEFLGEEEDTLVEYIVSNTRKHTGAAEMLELLTTILDDEAEMFVMKLWRMLIFEVKKIETGLASKLKG